MVQTFATARSAAAERGWRRGYGGTSGASADEAVVAAAAAAAAARQAASLARRAQHACTWNLRYPDAVSFPGMILWGGGTAGPAAAPGTYTVRLTADGRRRRSRSSSSATRCTDVTDADLKAQFDLAIKIRDKVSEANQAVIDIRNMKTQVADRLSKSQDAPAEGRRRSTRPRT